MAKYRSGTKQLHLMRDEGPSYNLSSQGDTAGTEEDGAVSQGPPGAREAWTVDQLAKSEFFHQKLHEWGMLEVANLIDLVRGKDLVWGVGKLGISEKAWARVIHRGIKPVTVFAHPDVLVGVPRAIAYYGVARDGVPEVNRTCGVDNSQLRSRSGWLGDKRSCRRPGRSSQQGHQQPCRGRRIA